MKKVKIFLFVLLFVDFLSLSQHAKRERSLNTDIVISKYETIVMEQGKSKVRPVFRVKNKGSCTYISIRLKFKEPEGLSDKGKVVKLPWNRSFNNSFTLKPGQEDTFIPYKKAHQNLRAETDQTITTYSTDCWFEFADVEGRLYRTPFYEIKEFVRVIPYNKDIVLSHYKSVVLEQGKSYVFPTFRLTNKGSRIYHDIFIKFADPKIKGTYHRLTLKYKNSKKITLKPGQEIDFNTVEKDYPYLRASSNQAVGIYDSRYSIEFRDEEDHTYKTPYVKFEKFVRVIPANPDIVVTDYQPLTVQQGESKITPVFRVKNKGKRTYRSVRLKYQKPVGILEKGRKREIGIVGYCWSPITLEPGQEVTYNPGCEGKHYIKTRPNQPPLTYSSDYWFEYYDSDGCLYRTPKKEIKDFIRVRPMKEDIVLVDYKTVELEQGKNKVVPVFKAKNIGSRTYTSVRIICKNVSGTTTKGKKDRLSVYNYSSPKATLKPGQAVTLNPALKESIYIKAKTDQAITTYSADYYFEYYDRDGKKYTTPGHEIKEFARVLPFNSDIIVSHFETVEMEQGKKNVQPLFRIKNRGKQTYTRVTLKYKDPEGQTNRGKKVSLSLFDSHWRETTLKPGQEMVFNPAHEDKYIHLNADEDQAVTVYSTHYWFEYRDSRGYTYKTPLREIKEFIRVVPIKRYIVLTGYKTLVAEQGTGRLCPLFEIKNRSKRTFRQVLLQYEPPKIITNNSRNRPFILIKGPRSSEWEDLDTRIYPPQWARVTLRPGQEMILNPSFKENATLQTHPRQPIGTYSTRYWLEYRDDNGSQYKTPKYEIKEFVKVTPMKEHLVLTGFKTIELMQGQDDLVPVLRVKNTSSHTYKEVKLVFSYKSFGTDSRGNRERLLVGDPVTKLEILKPGEEKQINPTAGDLRPFDVTARPDQLITTYQINYWFEYIDSDDNPRKSPTHRIKDFVRVVPYNKDIILTGFKTEIAAERGQYKGPLLVPTFRIKNTGSRIYTNLKVEYDLPEGFVKGTAGSRLEVPYDTDRRKGLKPGQEVEIKPHPNARLFRVKLKNPSQKVFSTQYRLHYYDAENCSYKTPKFTIERFVILKDE